MAKKKSFSLKNSCKYYTKALKYMPEGVSSNARLWRNPRFCYVGPAAAASLFLKRAYGSHAWDVDGNEYIDYRLALGPIILGHSYPAVENKVCDQIKKNGTIYGFGHELELEVAERFHKAVPSAESVKFSSTGTEATMHAVRLARAYTGRNVILKFEGHYHGTNDYLLFSTHPPYTWPHDQPHFQSAGIPSDIGRLVIVVPFNDFEAVEKAVKARYNEIAAIILEPIMGNAGAIPPKPGFLQFLRELCDRYDILLIFDEVKTGFRVALGGAQELYGVKPHISTYAKAMANGHPISAIAGEREVMASFGPDAGQAVHAGTFNSNPLCMTAVNQTIKLLSDGKVFKYLKSYNQKLMSGIEKMADELKIPVKISGVPGMFQIFYTERDEINNYDDIRNSITDFYVKVQYELMKEGVLIDADNQECIYTCYSHSNNDLKRTLNAFRNSMDKAAKSEYEVRPYGELG